MNRKKKVSVEKFLNQSPRNVGSFLCTSKSCWQRINMTQFKHSVDGANAQPGKRSWEEVWWPAECQPSKHWPKCNYSSPRCCFSLCVASHTRGAPHPHPHSPACLSHGGTYHLLLSREATTTANQKLLVKRNMHIIFGLRPGKRALISKNRQVCVLPWQQGHF